MIDADNAASESGTVLVADDQEANRALLKRLLTARGYTVLTARDGSEALGIIMQQQPDILLSDVRMPGVDGFELCEVLKASPTTRLLPVVLMTGASHGDDRVRAMLAGANDFLAKPIDEVELTARVRSLLQLRRFTDELDSAEAVLRSMALMVEARDSYTEGHCRRIASYATQLGRQFRLRDADLQALSRGGYFHDIGKIALPDAILLKPGKLTDEEFERMKQHPVVGDELCGKLRVLHRVRPIVRWHHERLDGSGYPDQLKGDAIPLLAQIISVCDVFDALTTTRPYRAAWTQAAALRQLEHEVELGWRRADLVAAFSELCRRNSDAEAAPPDPTAAR